MDDSSNARRKLEAALAARRRRIAIWLKALEEAAINRIQVECEALH